MKAKIESNYVALQGVEELPNDIGVIKVSCDDANDYLTKPSALSFGDRLYGKTGWNSDLFICYYRTDACLAEKIK